jgi:hypothetical protein
MNKAMLASYGRSLLASGIGIVFAVSQTVGKLPFEFSAQDWYAVANAIWVALIPVALRYLNPNDTAFGIVKE